MYFSAMDSELRYFVTIDKDVMNGNVLNILAQMGPEMTSAFATEILKPNNYEVNSGYFWELLGIC